MASSCGCDCSCSFMIIYETFCCSISGRWHAITEFHLVCLLSLLLVDCRHDAARRGICVHCHGCGRVVLLQKDGRKRKRKLSKPQRDLRKRFCFSRFDVFHWRQLGLLCGITSPWNSARLQYHLFPGTHSRFLRGVIPPTPLGLLCGINSSLKLS